MRLLLRPFLLLLILRAPFASAAAIYFVGTDHQAYELSDEAPYAWKPTTVANVKRDDLNQGVQISPSGATSTTQENTVQHYLDDPRGSDWVELPAPPARSFYDRAHVDGDRNLWVEFNGHDPGYHFQGDETGEMVLARDMRWDDYWHSGPRAYRKYVADPFEGGLYGLSDDGSVVRITPPKTERAPFHAETVLPAGTAADILPGSKTMVVSHPNGSLERLRSDGKFEALPSPPGTGEVFSSYEASLGERVEAFLKTLPPAPAPRKAPGSLSPQAVAAPEPVRARPSTFSADELAREIAARRDRVPEFQFIKEKAKELGVRVWLFGGTASGFGHYVNWDMKREHGDTRYQPERFNYDYTNIYRSTQDLDIVIDGTKEQAELLEKALAENFPHFQGSKSAWEVRLLKSDFGDKDALLNNPNFLNQHSDSNSTGLIELTQPKRGEAVVRDLRDWNAKEPYFLRDLHDGRLHYYFSSAHETTKRFLEGKNPPILSAIRFLTKAFQYDLEVRPEDEAILRRIIQNYKPGQGEDEYVSRWIEKNGKKLFQNAVNIEYAWKKLNELGLREKLAKIGSKDEEDSLAWWMNKQPLLTEPVGQGDGKTAAQIFAQRGLEKDAQGRLVVAHEPRTYLAYESITRAHTGEPNVLISRQGAAAEAAVYGNGFYTRAGREGAAGSGLHIRFALDPRAREGSDFLFVPDSEYFVLKNKAAFRVIPESLSLSLRGFFEVLTQDNSLFEQDRGILEKLRRQVLAKAALFSPEEVADVAHLVEKSLEDPKRAATVLGEWVRIPEKLRAKYDGAIVEKALASGQLDYEVAKISAAAKTWNNFPRVKALREQIEAWRARMRPSEAILAAENAKKWDDRDQRLVDATEEKYKSAALAIGLEGGRDPKSMPLRLSFLSETAQNGPLFFGLGPEWTTEFAKGLPPEGVNTPALMQFLLEHGVSRGARDEFRDEAVDQEVIRRFFADDCPAVSKELTNRFLAGLTTQGEETIVNDFPRFAGRFDEQMVRDYLRNGLATSLFSLEYEELSREKLQEIGKKMLNYRRHILPIMAKDPEALRELDGRLYETLKSLLKSDRFKKAANASWRNHIVSMLEWHLFQPMGEFLPKSDGLFTRRVRMQAWYGHAIQEGSPLAAQLKHTCEGKFGAL